MYVRIVGTQTLRLCTETRCNAHKTVVGAVGGLGLEPHGSVVGTSSVVGGVVSSGRVPSETDKDGGQRAICCTGARETGYISKTSI